MSTIDVEFIQIEPERIAKVTITPGWFARTVRRQLPVVLYARTLLWGTCWVRDDTGRSLSPAVEATLRDADYWKHDHPERLARAEERRRVNPDGTLRVKA